MRSIHLVSRRLGWVVSILALGLQLLGVSLLTAAQLGLERGYQVENWDTDDGLPQNSVTAIQQTQDGYLWLGTQNGLVRFDGMRCQVFSADTNPCFPGNRISCLFEDSEQRLWFGVGGSGIGCMQDGRIWMPRDLRVTDNTVTCITQDRGGAMWFGTVRGEVFRYADGLLRVYNQGNGLPGDPLSALVVDSEGLLWAVSGEWLGTLSTTRFEQHPWKITGFASIATRRAGGVWLATQTGVAHLSNAAGQAFCQIPNLGAVKTMREVRGGAVWLGLQQGGLLRVTEGQSETIGSDEGLELAPVLALTEDSEGHIWVGLRNGGLSRLKQRVIDLLDKRSGLREDNVLSVCEDSKGGVWLGTEAGLHWLDPQGVIRSFGEDAGLKSDQVTAVWEDRHRTLWVGTGGEGLFHRKGERFEPAGTGLTNEHRFIRSIYEDDQGLIWIGTRLNGAYCLGEFGVKAYDTTAGLAHSDVQCIYRDQRGVVWFGTGGGGLNYLREGQISKITTAQGLPSDFVRTLFEDERGALWVGTSGGLARVKDGKVVTMRTEQGLPDNFISQVFKDRRGMFWFGSNRGIFRVQGSELDRLADGSAIAIRCFIYNKAEGLGGRECNGGYQPAGCQTRDGRLWFPTPKGVAIVRPERAGLNASPPRVRIEEVVADGHLIPFVSNTGPTNTNGANREQLSKASQVLIPANCERLEIRYTAFNYAAPRRIQFQYRLGNGDRDWVEAGSERTAVYLQPAPGRSTFQVRAVSSEGVWGEFDAGLELLVESPFWRSGWFLGLAGTAAITVLAYGVRQVSVRRLRRSLVALEQDQAMNRERARIAADMHDQLGSRLTQLGLLGELARRDINSPASIAQQLDKITAQSREVAKSLDEIVWTVNPGNDTLEHTAAYIVHYAEEFLEPSAVRCRLDVPAVLPDWILPADHRHQLFLAFKEALTNVVRHAVATEVEVRLAVDTRAMVLSIRDNGHGFTLVKRDGNGLSNMRSRIEGIGGRWELTSQIGTGTCITFTVPLIFSAKRSTTTIASQDSRACGEI